jgi:UDP-glucose 4-epimerase
MVERALHWYRNAYGMRTLCLRYFNAAGADADGDIGEEHDPETHLIPLAIFAAMGRSPLRVFGGDYETADGTAIRDYIHVTDLADAHVRALRYLGGGGSLPAFNLGAGQGHSVRDLIQCVQRVSGREVPHIVSGRRAGDAPAMVADASLARRELGWEPVHSDLETITRTAWNWFNRSGA